MLFRSREILKDSHVGSFAVIGLMLLMLSQFALFASLEPNRSLWVLVLIPAVTRTAAGFAVDWLPSMSTSQYAGRTIFMGHLVFFGLTLLVLLALGFLCFGLGGLAPLGSLLGLSLALRRGYKSLEGMNGDISGYSITIGELTGILILAII